MRDSALFCSKCLFFMHNHYILCGIVLTHDISCQTFSTLDPYQVRIKWLILKSCLVVSK